MGDVAIVTDSSACLPRDLLERYAVRTVPLRLHLGERVYPDGSLTAAELFAAVDGSRARPQTASPSPGEFAHAFQAADANTVLCLTLSAAYSGTHDVALAGAQLAREQDSALDVRVVDTGGLAMTHGFAVLAAARALDAGLSVEEAAAGAARTGTRGTLIGALDTMRYLAKGGRVPWIVAWAASVLQVKPVLAFENGTARAIARVRTTSRARERLLDCAEERLAGRRSRIAVMHSDAEGAAHALAEAVCARFAPAEVLVTEFTSVMAVHTGPGFLGLAVCSDD